MAAEAERLRRGQGEWTEDTGRYVMSVAVAVTGIDAYRIRRYEQAGLLSPERTTGGQRLFSDRDIRRICEVAGLEAEGVNLRGIAVILRTGSNQTGRHGDSER